MNVINGLILSTLYFAEKGKKYERKREAIL